MFLGFRMYIYVFWNTHHISKNIWLQSEARLTFLIVLIVFLNNFEIFLERLVTSHFIVGAKIFAIVITLEGIYKLLIGLIFIFLKLTLNFSNSLLQFAEAEFPSLKLDVTIWLFRPHKQPKKINFHIAFDSITFSYCQ